MLSYSRMIAAKGVDPDSRLSILSIAVVAKHGCQPAFTGLKIHALASGVVHHLVLLDLADSKVLGLVRIRDWRNRDRTQMRQEAWPATRSARSTQVPWL